MSPKLGATTLLIPWSSIDAVADRIAGRDTRVRTDDVRSALYAAYGTSYDPSAENLARYFYEQTSDQLNEMTEGRVRVKDCTLYETDNSFARYYE